MDTNTILQIVGILVTIFGLAGIVWFFKNKNIVVNKDYLNLSYQIAGLIEGTLVTDDQVKAITRSVMNAVKFVELNMTNADNQQKEDASVLMIKEALSALNLAKPLDDNTIRNIIRIACMFLEKTNKTK